MKRANKHRADNFYLIHIAVYFAAQEGHLDCVHWLVDHCQADAQLASNDGMTPLHAAAQTGRLNVTHWLVRSAKCLISCRTCDGATPVHFAAAKGRKANVIREGERDVCMCV